MGIKSEIWEMLDAGYGASEPTIQWFAKDSAITCGALIHFSGLLNLCLVVVFPNSKIISEGNIKYQYSSEYLSKFLFLSLTQHNKITFDFYLWLRMAYYAELYSLLYKFVYALAFGG